MLRNSVAFITALYAIGFAFAALAAVRWPTLLALVALFGDSVSELNAQVDWRELGLIYGLVYLLAAYFFYITSSLISRHKRGSVVTYLIAIGIGFPPFILFDFDAGWWQNPDIFQQTVLLGGFLSVFLLGAILELNRTRDRNRATGDIANVVPAPLTVQAAPQAPILLASPIQSAPKPDAAPAPRRRTPVSAAILRQRQSFAYHGRKAKARRHR